MKRYLLLFTAFASLSLIGGTAHSAKPAHSGSITRLPTGFARTVVLWPAGAPGALGTTDEDIPRLFVYPPTRPEAAHTAVIVIPGGGYRTLVIEKEGADEARWLSAHGIEAFVLQYRLGPRYHFPAPLDDGARAVRYVRTHAHEFGLVHDNIGVWGFSAGAHLAGYLAAIHDQGTPNAPDPIDRASDRPDFAILAYGRLSMDPHIPRATNLEGLLGNDPTLEQIENVSIAPHVTRDTSPSFVYSTTGDQTVNALNATAYYDAMKRAGAPVELHIFEQGSHGIGMGQNPKSSAEVQILPTLISNWLQMHAWM